jgi:signal transduction histidine kinase
MADPIAADIEAIGQLRAVPAILEIVAAITGLRFAAVARVTGDRWVACAVLDKLGFGLKVGGELEVSTTLCHEIRGAKTPIIIDHASQDKIYCGHPTPRQYGFESYISVPIIRRDGEVFGTICALDPLPARLRDSKILDMVQLYAELIAAQLELEDQSGANKLALHDALATGSLREQFIGVLGHDLRNPLFSVISGLRLLGRLPPGQDPQPILRQMEQSCTRMSRLIDDILDFARGRLGGGFTLALRPVDDLGAELGRVVAELAATFPHRRLETDIRFHRPVTCDPDRVGQLLSNLLANALVHGLPDGLVQVRARMAGGDCVLEVTNQGPPIEPEIMARMFQPYSRASHGQGGVGLGLGLYIADEIAKAHGGTLSVRSAEATGTVFTFTWPCGTRPFGI